MTTFGWKKKVGERVSKRTAQKFEEDTKEEDDPGIEEGTIDWLSLSQRSSKVVCLEDNVAKSKRLRQEGTILAEQERYWEALKKWDAAIELNSQDARLYEMKAQAYTALCEVYPALQAARRAVELDPLWWEAWQTLGRAHLGLGEVRIALKTFCKAVHLHPIDKELWEEDIKWAYGLLKQKQAAEQERLKAEEKLKTPACTIRELEEGSDDDSDSESDSDIEPTRCEDNITDKRVRKRTYGDPITSTSRPKAAKTEQSEARTDFKPNEYVMMRDDVILK